MREVLAVGGLVAPTTTHLQRPDLELATQLNAFRSLDVQEATDGLLKDHKVILWFKEERFIPPGHVAQAYVEHTYGKPDEYLINAYKNDPTVLFGIPILEVEDEEGFVLRHVYIEPRVFHKDCPPEVPIKTMVVLPELAVLHRSRCFEHKENPAIAMAHAVPERGGLERNAFLRFREALETSEALSAFDTLFRHYSLNEELFRLDAWMKYLPFTLEEHPRMKFYRDMLEKQIGHLRGSASKWYAEGSPSAGIQLDTYVKGICTNPGSMPHRLQWLVTECRAKGYKKVAEYGSIEGVSLFHLIMHAADIEWHGFEVNPKNVKRGYELVKEAEVPFPGLEAKFHLHEMRDYRFERDDSLSKQSYDAVALFEALEHNSTEEGAELLAKAERLVKPGGTVFITTPWGNWSAWDEHTRDLELRKDHVNAYTVARMEKFLYENGGCVEKQSRRLIKNLKVEKVLNPSLHENNAWVHASYTIW